MADPQKILIVDDESRIVESLKKLLSECGWNLQSANNGLEAKERIREMSFDCILLDMVLPDSDGLEIMKFIKSESPDTKIIVVTGFASVTSAVECLKLGAHDYLKKPINPDELIRRIENALAIKRLREEKEIIHSRLKTSEERYQYLVHNSPDIIFTIDTGGTINFINDSVNTLLGYKKDNLIGKHWGVKPIAFL